jgi:hypothetical protein
VHCLFEGGSQLGVLLGAHRPEASRDVFGVERAAGVSAGRADKLQKPVERCLSVSSGGESHPPRAEVAMSQGLMAKSMGSPWAVAHVETPFGVRSVEGVLVRDTSRELHGRARRTG